MRSLTATLKAAQQAATIDALIKIELTYGATSYTYDRNRILDINHLEEPFTQKLELVLDNSDGILTALDLKGFKGIISYGAVASGNEYSACAPLWVIAQRLESIQGRLICQLSLLGIPNLLAEDKASESYLPEETDTKTVKTLIGEILGATLACYSHCTAYLVVWDSEDSLINTYKPKDSFRIYIGGSRLAAIKRLLDYTKCVMRAQADGKIHIFNPTVSGTTYDYEYSLATGHTFFAKTYRKRLVIPNYIVVKSQKDDTPQYSGLAQDSESYALLPKRDYHQMRLESNSQANDMAAAILSKYQLWSEMGAADVPMNVGSEVFDYVRVIDQRENDYRVGNIGHLARHYNANKAEWRMTFSFGNWQTVRKALAGLDLDVDELQGYFTRLYAKDAYIEHLWIDNIDAIWLDPEGNIIPENLGDFLDHIPQGEYNALVKAMHLDATGLTFSSDTLYTLRLSGEAAKKVWKSTTAQSSPGVGDLWLDTNFTPNRVKRWSGTAWQELPADEIADLEKGIFIREVKSSSLTADGLVFLDQLDTSGDYARTKKAALTADGLVLLDQVVVGTYGKVLSASLTAGGLVLLDQVVDGTYGKVKTTDISAGHIKLESVIDGGGYKKYTTTEYNKLLGIAEGADVTDGHSLSVLTDRTLGFIVDVTDRKAVTAGEKSGAGEAYNFLISKLTAYGLSIWSTASGERVELTASGLVIQGGKLTLKDSAGGNAAQLYIDTSGYLRLDAWLKVKSKSIYPVNDRVSDLGASPSNYWGNVYALIFNCASNGAIILPPMSALATARSIKCDTDGSLWILRPDNSTWRHIA